MLTPLTLPDPSFPSLFTSRGVKPVAIILTCGYHAVAVFVTDSQVLWFCRLKVGQVREPSQIVDTQTHSSILTLHIIYVNVSFIYTVDPI